MITAGVLDPTFRQFSIFRYYQPCLLHKETLIVGGFYHWTQQHTEPRIWIQKQQHYRSTLFEWRTSVIESDEE